MTQKKKDSLYNFNIRHTHDNKTRIYIIIIDNRNTHKTIFILCTQSFFFHLYIYFILSFSFFFKQTNNTISLKNKNYFPISFYIPFLSKLYLTPLFYPLFFFFQRKKNHTREYFFYVSL